MTDFLLLAFIFLIAGVVAVPIASRLGLGSVLGYLIAGIVISPVLTLLHVDVISIQDGPVVRHVGGRRTSPLRDNFTGHFTAACVRVAYRHVVAILAHVWRGTVRPVDPRSLLTPPTARAHSADPWTVIGADEPTGTLAANQHRGAGPGQRASENTTPTNCFVFHDGTRFRES